MKKLCLAVLFTLVFFTSSAFAALSVDDFIPPVQVSQEAEKAELLKVQDPDGVSEIEGEITGEPAISAKSAQDAINHWADKRVAGFTEVIFPEGFGFVATGIGTYGIYDNPVSSRISKRNAYVTAYMQAKRLLAEGLNGVITRGNTRAFERIATVNESLGQSLINAQSLSSESIVSAESQCPLADVVPCP